MYYIEVPKVGKEIDIKTRSRRSQKKQISWKSFEINEIDESVITLKDQNNNFQNQPTAVISPAKNKISRKRKQILRFNKSGVMPQAQFR